MPSPAAEDKGMGRKAIRAAFARPKGGLLVMEARANLRQTHLPYIRQELPVSSGLLSEISQSIRMARQLMEKVFAGNGTEKEGAE